MKSITLSDNELDYIRKFYESELEETERYVTRVREVLLKLKGAKRITDEDSNIKEVKPGKKRGRKPGRKVVVEKAAPKRRGRKPKSTVAELNSVTESVVVQTPKKTTPEAKPDGAAPKKRGRKHRVIAASLKALPETDATKFGHDDSKPSRAKKKLKKRSRRKRGTPIFGKKVLLAPVAEPVELKEVEIEASELRSGEMIVESNPLHV